METIVLASSSPRRKELLRSLSIPFVSIHPDIDESFCDYLEPGARVVALAEAKAEAGFALLGQARTDKPRLLLAADTLVAFKLTEGWKAIGKPENRAEAKRMLEYMSGRTQSVFSGLCLIDTRIGSRFTALSETSVAFAEVNDEEIEFYLDTDEWHGAAGAYRIQGSGSCFIDSMNGSWSNVVGLPIRELYVILKAAGYDFGFSGRRPAVS